MATNILSPLGPLFGPDFVSSQSFRVEQRGEALAMVGAKGRPKDPDESIIGSGERVELILGGEVQGACPQEVPSAIEVARSPMREAKLGRQKARVMRSYK